MNIPTGGSQQETGGLAGWVPVRVAVRTFAGDLSIHFTQCGRGCKRKKPKGLNGRTWMGGSLGEGRDTFFICLSPRGHICCREEASHGGSSPPPLTQRGLLKHSTKWLRLVRVWWFCQPHARHFVWVVFLSVSHELMVLHPWGGSHGSLSKGRMVYIRSCFTPQW